MIVATPRRHVGKTQDGAASETKPNTAGHAIRSRIFAFLSWHCSLPAREREREINRNQKRGRERRFDGDGAGHHVGTPRLEGRHFLSRSRRLSSGASSTPRRSLVKTGVRVGVSTPSQARLPPAMLRRGDHVIGIGLVVGDNLDPHASWHVRKRVMQVIPSMV